MYTSLKLSKKLKKNGCKLESDFYWIDDDGWELVNKENWEMLDSAYGSVRNIVDTFSDNNKYDIFKMEGFRAYDILNDICVKYAKKFFGSNKCKMLAQFSMDGTGGTIEDNTAYTTRILWLLQQGKKEEVEDYIWEHCLFNLKNNN